ncbi:hypothetical protein FJ959_09830 [Mesorhizobium sp. B2-2-4]|uniref:hypothetical protein n=1 Tax=unclassified Mesorhizobium TaxID=325217 RepID=UPI001128CE3D|nr:MULTISPECIES: hypothetical protein [unclassified Mesorhizobium]TPM59158.1 hypothetical protein FJ959_09830 [Mesorhizobium sp. B2-2-4]TPM67643.1 hypothetical protein FJ965_10970 [Mesorhizobium sp. B2-2-1]TPN66925.1 hypothetical protein FJ984_15835 [Mesorhizobium sp. B1-1-3]
MTIDLPAVRFQLTRPALVDSVSVDRAGERYVGFMEYADSYWQIPMRTKSLRASELMLVQAFGAQARLGKVTVVWRPVDICLPQAYWGNPTAPALADDGNLVSVTNGFTVAINGVVNGLTMMPGDLFSLQKAGNRSLHRVVVGAVAAAGAIGLTVEPAIPVYITAGAIAKFLNPELNCRVVPGSFVIPDDHKPVAAFTLVEVPK